MMRRFKKYICYTLIASIFISISGCATTYSKVDRAEIEAAEEELRVKALGFQLTQLRKVNDIWGKLIFSLPYDEKKDPYPDIGIIVLDVNKYSQKLFNLPDKDGVVIVYVAPNSPAEKAGIKVGDKLNKIDGKEIKNTRQCAHKFRKLKPGDEITFTVSRKAEQVLTKPITVGKKPFNAPVNVIDMQSVNAAASPNGVYVTYGMLRFTNSDDETAAILAHELAHLKQGHLAKAQGAGFAGMLLVLGLGIAAEVLAPGSGEAVLRGSNAVSKAFQAQYSQDLEREADYYSVHYIHSAGYDMEICGKVEERLAIEVPRTMISGFLSTHPSSPERLARIRQTIKEIREKEAPEEEIPAT